MTFAPSSEPYPFRSRWLKSCAGRVHYVDEGSGQPIVMCHGNPTWSFRFQHLIGALRDRFRCIAVDIRGLGFPNARPATGTHQGEHATVVGQLVMSSTSRR